MPSCGARMSMRRNWSSAVTLRSTNSPILSLASRRSLETSLSMSLSTWMTCNSVSVILPLACAREPRRIALERRQSRELHQMLVIELADADQLLFHQRDFLVLGGFLRLE